jgi:mannose/fructose-specific phosphotransferase system component IIA
MTFGSGFKPSATMVLGTTANRQCVVTFRSDGTNLIEQSRTAMFAT